jgi:hypothetical protein
MGWVILVLVAVVVLAAVCLIVWLVPGRGDIPQEIRDAIRAAKQSRSNYRRARKQHNKNVAQARSRLQILEDTKGRRLGSADGITRYERWISTPQGSGSLIGVKATAADESSITVSQRLTATRMVALGVFSLAAPKKKQTAHGSAYILY